MTAPPLGMALDKYNLRQRADKQAILVHPDESLAALVQDLVKALQEASSNFSFVLGRIEGVNADLMHRVLWLESENAELKSRVDLLEKKDVHEKKVYIGKPTPPVQEEIKPVTKKRPGKAPS